jgi:gliding motility associated protien GldN
MNKKIILGVLLVMFMSVIKAQSYGDIYQKSIPDAKKIDYAYLREADVVWSKRYYRLVDLREKMNFPLYYPIIATKDGRTSFVNLLFDEISKGNINAYDPAEPELPTTYSDIEKKLGSVSRVQKVVIDQIGNTKDTVIPGSAKREEVKQLLLYEEWYFDKKLSKLDVRIIAIIPYFMGFNQELGRNERTQVCWVWFDDIRDIMAKNEVFSTNNDAQRISFDDLWMQRRFSSIILGESNVYNDRMISNYLVGKSALFEADRLKKELTDLEHDLWEY